MRWWINCTATFKEKVSNDVFNSPQNSKIFVFQQAAPSKNLNVFFFLLCWWALDLVLNCLGEMKQQCLPSHYRFQLSFLLLWMRFSMSPSMKWHCAPPLSSSLILAYQFLTFCLVSISALEVLTIAIHLPLFPSEIDISIHGGWEKVPERRNDTRENSARMLPRYLYHAPGCFLHFPRSNHWLRHDCFSFVLFILNPKSPQNMYM